MWSQIIQTSRNWARLVWIHCGIFFILLSSNHLLITGPDSLTATPPEDSEERKVDRLKAEIEKATVVRMAAAFATAVKHYLRGEEGM
jgi:hypothetical protein